MIIDS